MGVAAIVEDGKIKNATSTTSTKEKSSTLGKDDFLQLLVAQMKFQDPLEPTSNTEYIAQYAYRSLPRMITAKKRRRWVKWIM